MTVNITWALAANGADINDLNAGNVSAGSETVEQTLFVRHDGDSQINNCRIYISPKATGYTGATTSQDDYLEILGWGDALVAADFGGLQFNFDSNGGFPASAYGTVTTKDPTNGKTVRTGVGNTVLNGIQLPSATGISVNGIIKATEESSFRLKFKVPTSEGVTGNRQVDLKLRYTFTS